MEYLHIDSTTVIAHQHSAGAKQSGPELEDNYIGRSVGGNSTKIHALVDALGNPVEFLLTEGNRHDGPVALELLQIKVEGTRFRRRIIIQSRGRWTGGYIKKDIQLNVSLIGLNILDE